MKKIFAIILSACMLFSLCAAAAYADDAAEPLYYELGDTVEDFTVELCDGTVVSLYEMLETHDLVMINVWATWCGPCKAEFPIMNEAYDMYSDVVGLVCLSPFDDNEAVAAFKDEQSLTLPMGYDSIGADGFVMEGYPTTVIIDRFGTYVYYECGSIQDIEGFTDMWDFYIGEDYTESVVYIDNGAAREVEPLSTEILTDALCSTPETIVFNSIFDDEYVWPFLVSENGVVNSNAGVNKSVCTMIATVKAAKGDVFAIDYSVATEAGYDYITVYVNDIEIKHISGNGEGTFVYEFKKDGDFNIEFSFAKDEYDDYEFEDLAAFANARLLSGDDAQALLDAQPDYPHVLSADNVDIDILNESAKEIILNDETGTVEAYYSDVRFYLIPEDFGFFRGVIGSKLDPDSIWMYGDCDYMPVIASQTEYDEEGFLFEAQLACIEDGNLENTYVVIEDYAGYAYSMIIVFKNEENVNFFVKSMNESISEDGSAPITWEYADGTQPSTDAVAQVPGEMPYEIYFIDENGEPVDGVMVNVCTEETCTPAMTEGGYYAFDGEPVDYSIHVLKVPEGYAFDTSEEFIMTAGGDVLVITIPHA